MARSVPAAGAKMRTVEEDGIISSDHLPDQKDKAHLDPAYLD